MLTLPPSEFVDIDTGLGRVLCWLRIEACGCWASLAPGRRASRVANRQQKRTRSRVKRLAHPVNKSRKIVD